MCAILFACTVYQSPMKVQRVAKGLKVHILRQILWLFNVLPKLCQDMANVPEPSLSLICFGKGWLQRVSFYIQLGQLTTYSCKKELMLSSVWLEHRRISENC